MIEEVKCFVVYCDVCSTPYEGMSFGSRLFPTEEDARIEAFQDNPLDGFYKEWQGKIYCPMCIEKAPHEHQWDEAGDDAECTFCFIWKSDLED